MKSARILAVSIPLALLLAPALRAGDLSRYREFQFGMDLPTVVKLVKMNSSDVKVIHQRPGPIQELDWHPSRLPETSPDPGPLQNILFSFYNNELFRMVVTYDRYKTDGMTAEDMIEAISASYGKATRPTVDIIFPSIYHETAKIVARWEDGQYKFSLVRPSYQLSFAMVASSKRLDALAEAAIIEAIRLDKQEAPRKEAELQSRQDEERRVQQEKARVTNKASFRP